MTISELNPDEYNAYYLPYIERAGDGNIFNALRNNHNLLISFVNNIDKDRLDYRYAEGKWTIKEIVQHLIDTERIFNYRALCIARCDKIDLPGFDQDVFVAHSHANERSIGSLMAEYKRVRLATISLFESFDQKALAEIGIASNSVLSVRAVAFIIVGHETHHLQVIKERYL